MNVEILPNAKELGKAAAVFCSRLLKQVMEEKGSARIVLSTGASQFDTLDALTQTDVDWTRVEMFHLDEYIGLEEKHPASFRKYLKERFVERVPLKKGHFVNGERNVQEHIETLTREIRREPIDLALIGIGENAHIAFNDPPANFDTKDAFIVVDLAERCKKQQVGEGWFASLEEVPKKAISMTVHQIMQSRVIVSCVPYQVKADAIRALFQHETTNQVPATILKTHPEFHLFLDEESASKIDRKLIRE
ncbi:glucosamine-6-phosphate deaminase [Aneurinibacillus tyrosinisolvens]|uniref:glucosamine-6-phosphate deaminase n=1 Tax=Aneurinibacillus tyrosinisolvens TaxID=1443435 RepID=UPI00063F43B5|nr:glucosamine-6-phosphate deaminase [Aneurinibacillus tyrosinisolvens]